MATPFAAFASAPAVDDACSGPTYAAADTWDGLNGGSGFGAWQVIPAVGNANSGAFIGDANSNGGGGGPGINAPSGCAWGLYANSGAEIVALRPFTDGGLINGQRFSIDFDNGYIDGPYSANNVAEVQLLNAAGEMRFGFHFRGGASEYQLFDAASPSFERGTGVPFTDGGLHLVFTQGAGDTYALKIVRLANATTTTVTGVLGGTAGTAIDRLFLVHRNAGPGSSSDSFFNNLALSCDGQPPAPAAGSDSPRCVGQDLHLTAGSVANGVYHWTGPGGFTSSEQNPTVRGVTLANAGSYGVNVTVNGCVSATASTSVSVVAPPAQPSPSNDGPACAGGDLHLFANTLADTYTWTGPGGFTSSERNPTLRGVTAANAGTYNLVVSINGCTSPMGSTTATILPSAVTWPSDIVIECGTSTDPVITGVAVASGACGTPDISHEDNLNAGECPVLGVLTRSWTATFPAGFSLHATQTITIVDTVAPSLNGVPPDATVSCNAVPPPARVSAVDAGGFEQGVPTLGLILYYDFEEPGGTVAVDDSGHGNNGVIANAVFSSSGYRGGARYFNGSSACIRVPHAPELNSARFTVTAWVNALSTGTPAAPRGIFGKHQATYDEQSFWLFMDGTNLKSLMWGEGSPGPIQTPAAPFVGAWKMVTMTFDGAQQRLYVNDQLIGQRTVAHYEANTLDLLIGAGEYSFDYDFGGGQPSQWWHGYIDEVRVYDRALNSNEVSHLYVGQAGNAVFAEREEGDCPRVITRTWTASDACGNSATATQVLRVVDTVPPVLAGVPSDLSVDCEDAVPLPVRVTASDNCTAMEEPAFMETESVDGFVETISRTWTATDACGNSTTAVQRITVHDTIPPVLVGVPGDTTVDDGAVPPPAEVVADDECGYSRDLPPGNGLVLCYTFDADHGAVVPDESGHGHTGRVCNAAFTPNGHRGGAYYFDGEDDVITVQHTALLQSPHFTVSAWVRSLEANVTSLARGALGKHQAGFNHDAFWIFQDASGLNAQLWGDGAGATVNAPAAPTVDQWALVTMTYDGALMRFYINDELAGEREELGYTGDERDLLIGAGEGTFNGGMPSRWWHGFIDEVRFYERPLTSNEVADLYEDTASRGEEIPVQFLEITNGLNPMVLSRVWRAVDAGGNSVCQTQHITVIRKAPLVLSGQGADATIACPATPAFTAPTASGGCDDRPAVSFVDATAPGSCAGSYSVTRTWTAADSCGNTSAPVSQTITVIDTTPPVMSCASNQVVPGCGGVVVFAQPTAWDECSGPATVTCTPPSGSALSPGDHTIRCVASDACGNTSTCSFVVTVRDHVRVVFAPGTVADDNADDNIEIDLDVANTFKAGSKIPLKVRLYDCSGRDVTASLAPRATVKVNVTLRRPSSAGGSELVTDLPENYSGTGRPGGVMELTGGFLHYNLDTTGYPAGTLNAPSFIRAHVTAELNGAPGVVAGEEDALLESK